MKSSTIAGIGQLYSGELPKTLDLQLAWMMFFLISLASTKMSAFNQHPFVIPHTLLFNPLLFWRFELLCDYRA
jgi:hypothetical protein